MTNKTTKRALIASIIALVLCILMLIGTTAAWFTDSVSNTNNIIKSGNVDVELWHTNKADVTEEVDGSTALFTNVNGEKMLWEPNQSTGEVFTIKNVGSLALKYELRIKAVAKNSTEDGNSLTDVINLTVKGDSELYNDFFKDGYVISGTLLAGAKVDYNVDLTWNQTENDNLYNVKGGLFIVLGIDLVATQTSHEVGGEGANYDGSAGFSNLLNYVSEVFKEGQEVDIFNNGKLVATGIVGKNGSITYETEYFSEVKILPSWDGDEADTAWYNETDTAFVLNTASQIAGLASLVDNGTTFEGKTIELGRDINLANKLMEPIGSYRKEKAFKGVFDGKGYTIYNLFQNTWKLNNGYYYGDLGLGLFGKVEDATIKNLNIDGAEISGESALCGVVAATAYGDCVFENITVSNAKCNDYQYYAGGVVGWASSDENGNGHVYKNIVIDESTTIGGQWGDFNNANGGVIGGCGSSTKIKMEDCTIACRIDAVNDIVSAYQWYTYRRSGMLIGDSGQKEDPDGDNVGTAIAPNLTCKNVTVIYGDWANYTYCEFAGTGYPYVRVQAGVSVDAYSNVRYGHPTDANGNTVVDDNHVHNDGEDHHLPIVFDQLYGGETGDRYATYGATKHEGVTVIYNNK